MADCNGRAVCACRLIAWIAGSNPTEGTDVLLLFLLCDVQVAVSATSWSLVQRSPTRCVHLNVCNLETSKRCGLGPIQAVVPQRKSKLCKSVPTLLLITRNLSVPLWGSLHRISWKWLFYAFMISVCNWTEDRQVSQTFLLMVVADNEVVALRCQHWIVYKGEGARINK
jgi:hypothetical protein